MIAGLTIFYSRLYCGESMSAVYVFEGKVVKYAGNRYVIYPPKEYQEKLRKHHGRKVKVLVVVESE